MVKVFIILIFLAGLTIGILDISGAFKNSENKNSENKNSQKYIQDIQDIQDISNKKNCTGFIHPIHQPSVKCDCNLGDECDVNIFNKPP